MSKDRDDERNTGMPGEETFSLEEILAEFGGGAGQPRGLTPQKQARAEGLYEADCGSLIKSSQANPILNALYQKITTEEAHHLLHVHYPGEDAQA